MKPPYPDIKAHCYIAPRNQVKCICPWTTPAVVKNAKAIVRIFTVDKLAYFRYNGIIRTVRYEKRSRDPCRLILRRMGEIDMDLQNFLPAAIAFGIGSFVGSTAFYQILPELQEIKNEKSVGSVLTCLAWIAVLVAGVIFAFKYSTIAGGFAIFGIFSGLMTTIRMLR